MAQVDRAAITAPPLGRWWRVSRLSAVTNSISHSHRGHVRSNSQEASFSPVVNALEDAWASVGRFHRSPLRDSSIGTGAT